MVEFLKMLQKFDTVYEKITDNEIVIPCLAVGATEEQGDMLPQDYYQENSLLSDSAKIHLIFENNRIDWLIVDIMEEED